MSVTGTKDAKVLVGEYVKTANSLIHEAIKTKQIAPRKKSVHVWRFKDFEYTDQGVKSSGQQGSPKIKNDWLGMDFVLQDWLSETLEYQKLLSALKQIFEEHAESLLGDFSRKITTEILDEHESKIPELESNFIKQIQGGALKSKAKVEIIGLTLQQKSIKISNQIQLRQVRKEDLEREIETHYELRDMHPYPTVILSIESEDKQPAELQKKVEKAITILRLYKAGTVRYLRYHLSSELFGSMFGGTISTMDIVGPVETAVIKENETENLIMFWEHFYPIISTKLDLHSTTPSFREIAFQRYTEALSKGNTVEQRISTTIMGLEGILLRDHGELQELSYRLRLRVAKILGFFGYDPFGVKRMVSETYGIRSKFVHGGILDYEAKEKLSEKFGDSKKPLLELLNYLRLILLVSISMNISKEEFVDVIDKSFLSEEYNTRLKNIVTSTKSIINIK